jgi:TonB family protein
MFDVLMGSRSRRERRIGRGIMSAVLHIVTIAGVAMATAGRDPGEPSEPRIVDLLLDVAVVPAPVSTSTMTAPSGIAPAPLMVPSIVAPVEVPAGIPPVTIHEPWNPRNVVLRSGPSPIAAGLDSAGIFHPDSILAESAVDEPASVLRQRAPRYPPTLQAAGLEGRVSVRFVIDGEGRVEPGSVRITSATHAGFEESARETIIRTLFRPARARGRPVRQWAEQSVVYRITP